jgi:hypothetical protein
MGWRFFFYANERDEPIYIHCRKAEKECKYWLDREAFGIEEAYSFSMNDNKRQVKKLIFEYFEFIEDEWDGFQRRRQS